MSRFAYRPEVDGLRAVAVLSVVLFHGKFDGFSGGYVGVDVFFVISGYVITSILLADLAAGRFSLAGFYERRVRRIAPAFLLVVLTCLPAAWLWLTPHALAEFGESVIWACVFLANIFFLDHSDYFDGEMDLKPLAHTWSLAVEEQYYLVFPALLALMTRSRRIAPVWWLGAIALASLAYAEHASSYSPQAAFYLLPARMWELLLGSLVAWRLHRHDLGTTGGGRWYAELAAALGLLLIAVAVVTYDVETPVPGLVALVPTGGAALVILFARGSNWTGRVLASRPLVGIGLISYSTYLWHQPLFAFYRHATKASLTPGIALLLAATSLGLGYLSWRFVETRFRRREGIAFPVLGRYALATVFVVMATSFAAVRTDGLAQHYYAHRASDIERRVHQLQSGLREAKAQPAGPLDNGDCRFYAEVIDEAFRARFAGCADRYGQASIVIGDSHAQNIHRALHDSDYGGHFLIGLIRPGCRADNLRVLCPYAQLLRFVEEHRERVGQLVYHQSGSYLIADGRGRLDSDAAFAAPGAYALRLDEAKALMHYLDRLAEFVPTVWLGPFAEARVDIAQPPSDGLLRMNPVSLKAFAELDAALRSATDERESHWRYLSMLEVTPMNEDFLVQGECLTFKDRDHLSPCGEQLVAGPLGRSLAVPARP